MSTSEIEDSLRKIARLQAEIDKLDQVERRAQRGLARRVYSHAVAGIVVLVLVVLGVDGWFAYDTFRHGSSEPGPGTTVASGPAYDDLQVYEDAGMFAGKVAITNPMPRDMEVTVTVNVYDGEQQVGEISGHVTLKPDSTSVVELTGSDVAVPFSDSRIHLDGWPA